MMNKSTVPYPCPTSSSSSSNNMSSATIINNSSSNNKCKSGLSMGEILFSSPPAHSLSSSSPIPFSRAEFLQSQRQSARDSGSGGGESVTSTRVGKAMKSHSHMNNMEQEEEEEECEVNRLKMEIARNNRREVEGRRVGGNNGTFSASQEKSDIDRRHCGGGGTGEDCQFRRHWQNYGSPVGVIGVKQSIEEHQYHHQHHHNSSSSPSPSPTRLRDRQRKMELTLQHIQQNNHHNFHDATAGVHQQKKHHNVDSHYPTSTPPYMVLKSAVVDTGSATVESGNKSRFRHGLQHHRTPPPPPLREADELEMPTEDSTSFSSAGAESASSGTTATTELIKNSRDLPPPLSFSGLRDEHACNKWILETMRQEIRLENERMEDATKSLMMEDAFCEPKWKTNGVSNANANATTVAGGKTRERLQSCKSLDLEREKDKSGQRKPYSTTNRLNANPSSSDSIELSSTVRSGIEAMKLNEKADGIKIFYANSTTTPASGTSHFTPDKMAIENCGGHRTSTPSQGFVSDEPEILKECGKNGDGDDQVFHSAHHPPPPNGSHNNHRSSHPNYLNLFNGATPPSTTSSASTSASFVKSRRSGFGERSLSCTSSSSSSGNNGGCGGATTSTITATLRSARSLSLRQTSADSVCSEGSETASPDDRSLPSLQRAMSCDSVSSDTSVVMVGDGDELPQPTPTGFLSVGLEYDSETADLLVNVIEAKELVGPDPNNSSAPFDSYVRVYLLPDKTTNMQTRVYRKSVTPVYREKFMFGVETMEIPLRTLVFYLYASDRHSNTLVGETELKLRDVDIYHPHTMWLQLTDTGQRGGEAGEILFSLSYLPTAERLTVVVVKARNLKFPHEREVGDPFVKVYLLQKGKKVSKKKSSTKKGEGHPIFNEAMIFSVPVHLLQTIQLRITVADTSELQGRAVSVGHVIVSSLASGKELSHWNQMLTSLRKPIAMWHPLRK